jgi:hypothetical protein
MAKKISTRTIVGSPLEPALLSQLRAVDEFPATPKDFDPQAGWVNTYRIWTCHGFRESGNQNVGFVRIERAAGKTNEPFMLKVRQEVLQTDGLLHTIEAEIRCSNNQLASPVQWHLSSRFVDHNRKIVDDLGTQESAVVDGNIINIRVRGGHRFRREVGGKFTSDLCLFEAVQRLKFNKTSSLAFNMLEGLSLVKKQQRLMYRGVYTMKMSSKELSLHRFDQIGEGILPCEYWLDHNHRLLVITSMNKAYILDEKVE